MTSHKLCLMDEQNKSLDWPLQDWTISCNQESHRQINQSWKSLLVGSCCSTSSWWETLHHTPADKQSNSQTEWTLDASCSLLTTETKLTCRTAEKRKRQPECNENIRYSAVTHAKFTTATFASSREVNSLPGFQTTTSSLSVCMTSDFITVSLTMIQFF